MTEESLQMLDGARLPQFAEGAESFHAQRASRAQDVVALEDTQQRVDSLRDAVASNERDRGVGELRIRMVDEIVEECAGYFPTESKETLDRLELHAQIGMARELAHRR